MSEPEILTADPAPRPPRRRKFRRWSILALFIIGLIWLNGPGLRWIVPKVATHFLEKAGIRASLSLQGSLTGGLFISDFHLEGDKGLAALSVDKITPVYQLSKLINGQIDSITIDGLHADLRLGLKKEQTETPPLDLAKLVETIRNVRGRVIPVSINLKNISLSATRDGRPIFNLSNSSLIHRSGSDEILLELGTITDPSGKQWPAQKSSVIWNPDNISIEQLDPYPGISVRGFVMQLPAGGEPSLETQVHVDDAVFAISKQ